MDNSTEYEVLISRIQVTLDSAPDPQRLASFQKTHYTLLSQLTEVPNHRNNDDPSWSPDGTKIIFSTGRSGLFGSTEFEIGATRVKLEIASSPIIARLTSLRCVIPGAD